MDRTDISGCRGPGCNPAVGLLWTPGYWDWSNGVYVFNQGYWGPHVGYYGGINYGFGYGGVGYQGGYWNNGAFNYNRAVNNIGNTNITNVYNRTVVNNTTVNNVSYNGGSGGTVAQPTAARTGFRTSAACAAHASADRSPISREDQSRAVGLGQPGTPADRRDAPAGCV